jgi:hypothetical protein
MNESEYVGLICPLRSGFACVEKKCAWYMVPDDTNKGGCAILHIAQAQDYQAAWRMYHWNEREGG